ncbi:MAG TPA: hypothetical protein VKZ89_14830 [Thermobifida alba]|nr:hypothetical protein [Thermobifida alba]
MATDRSESNKAAETFKELAEVEFDAASDIQTYVKKVKDLSKAFALELEFAAEDLENRLRSVDPASEEETGIVIARKAARVAKPAKRAAEAAREVGTNMSKVWGSLNTHFDAQMGGRKVREPKKKIDLES